MDFNPWFSSVIALSSGRSVVPDGRGGLSASRFVLIRPPHIRGAKSSVDPRGRGWGYFALLEASGKGFVRVVLVSGVVGGV